MVALPRCPLPVLPQAVEKAECREGTDADLGGEVDAVADGVVRGVGCEVGPAG